LRLINLVLEKQTDNIIAAQLYQEEKNETLF